MTTTSKPDQGAHASTEIKMEERLAFIGMDQKAREHLRALKPVLNNALGAALTVFYNKIRVNSYTKSFFSDEKHMASAQSRQEEHWKIIADAEFNDAYARAVLGVGKAHARLGLEPRWYIGGYALVIEQLIHSVLKERWPRFVYRGQGLADDMAGSLSSLVKAALLDMDLSISIYLDELATKVRAQEELRKKAEKSQSEAVQALGEALNRLSHGDLGSRITADVAPEFEKLKNDFNNTVLTLQESFAAVAASATSINVATNEIASAANDLSKRTEAQAAGLEESTAALAEVTEAIRATAENSRRANDIVSNTKGGAERGGEIVLRAIDAMGRIEKSSNDIGQITDVIDAIAFQTNLLALNAGVEAARAGEAGRGFAVVASEVRALAQRSAEAAKEISSLITGSGKAVTDGANLVRQAGDALKAIVGQVGEVANVVSKIAEGAKEQSVALGQISVAIGEMDQATQHNAAMVEETTAAASSLSNEASQLVEAISKFEIKQGRQRSAERLKFSAVA